MRVVNTTTVTGYTWQEVCTAWPLVETDMLSIKQEYMPPGASEQRHYHKHARQFFFVLSGTLTLEVSGKHITLGPQDGAEIAPLLKHQAKNMSDQDVTFIVTSSPSTDTDRHPA